MLVASVKTAKRNLSSGKISWSSYIILLFFTFQFSIFSFNFSFFTLFSLFLTHHLYNMIRRIIVKSDKRILKKEKWKTKSDWRHYDPDNLPFFNFQFSIFSFNISFFTLFSRSPIITFTIWSEES
jgi:hypothetical protein